MRAEWGRVMNLRMRYIKDYFAQRKVRAVLAWIAEIALVIALAAFLAFFFGQKVTMQEGSMEPTITAGEELLVNKASYALGSPKRGDIIVFRNSEDEKSSLHIKRVIGLPGETIQIRDGQIIIDGKTYIEEKEFPPITDPGLAEDEITLDAGEFFVLGDNRNSSEDSRHVDMGMVQKKNIIGKLWLAVSPWKDFGFVK